MPFYEMKGTHLSIRSTGRTAKGGLISLAVKITFEYKTDSKRTTGEGNLPLGQLSNCKGGQVG